jgi:hypothetical protein
MKQMNELKRLMGGRRRRRPDDEAMPVNDMYAELQNYQMPQSAAPMDPSAGQPHPLLQAIQKLLGGGGAMAAQQMPPRSPNDVVGEGFDQMEGVPMYEPPAEGMASDFSGRRRSPPANYDAGEWKGVNRGRMQKPNPEDPDAVAQFKEYANFPTKEDMRVRERVPTDRIVESFDDTFGAHHRLPPDERDLYLNRGKTGRAPLPRPRPDLPEGMDDAEREAVTDISGARMMPGRDDMDGSDRDRLDARMGDYNLPGVVLEDEPEIDSIDMPKGMDDAEAKAMKGVQALGDKDTEWEAGKAQYMELLNKDPRISEAAEAGDKDGLMQLYRDGVISGDEYEQILEEEGLTD